MTRRINVVALIAGVALAGSLGCTTKTNAPTLSGPSELSTSITIYASPDTLSQDGASQAQITIQARDARSQPIANLPVRLDTMANGVTGDFGQLSTRQLVTAGDGRATASYTAPDAPLTGADVLPSVTILATPVGTDATGTLPRSVTIRLTSSANGPKAVIAFSPNNPLAGTDVVFDGGRSAVTGGRIVSYAWDFGDGTTGSGSPVTHRFGIGGTYTVQLTVTDSNGGRATTTNKVTVASSAGTPPTAAFVVSPTSPSVAQTVFFNGGTSTGLFPITSYAWNFGDGSTGSGVTTSHAYATVGTFVASLTVTDSNGRTSTATKDVTVASSAGTPPTPAFTFSPTSPGVNESVFFNGSTSKPGSGHTIVSYNWTFGDGWTGTGVTQSHPYATAGTYSVQLNVTDEVGQSVTSAVQTVTVGNPPAPKAKFTFSPIDPPVGQQVVFDASSSELAQGQTITDVAWNFGDGTPVVHCPGDPSCVIANGTNRITAHTYSFIGTFEVNLVVTDSAGRTGSINHQVKVVSPNPTALLFLANTGAHSVDADGSGSTSTGSSTIATYRFIWGDATADSSGTASRVTHTYAAAGTYTVTLVVTDSSLRGSSTSKDIIVP